LVQNAGAQGRQPLGLGVWCVGYDAEYLRGYDRQHWNTCGVCSMYLWQRRRREGEGRSEQLIALVRGSGGRIGRDGTSTAFYSMSTDITTTGLICQEPGRARPKLQIRKCACGRIARQFSVLNSSAQRFLYAHAGLSLQGRGLLLARSVHVGPGEGGVVVLLGC
jgi:hypothetical protein